jgi:hypothetical protein
MKIKHIFATACGSFLLTFSASASSVPLVVGTYNFQLDGGGGGAEATLNGGATVQIFCDNFANEIYAPSNDTANVTQLGTSENLSETRFGGVSSWTAIDLTSGATAATDNTFFADAAGSSAAARYAMVAYLVSQYNVVSNNTTANNTTANNQIQEAIWTLMDPAAYATASPAAITLINPSGTGVPTADLEAAANWYLGGGATNAFLSQFEVVSDIYMTPGTSAQGYVGQGGFQEQIVFTPTPTPEPRGSIWMLIGLFGVGGFLLQRARAKKLAPATTTA